MIEKPNMNPEGTPEISEEAHALLEEALSGQIRERAVKEMMQDATTALIEVNAAKGQKIQELETGIEELIDEASELKTLAVRDPLTGLDNRRGLEDHVRRILSRVPPPDVGVHRQEGAIHHVAVLALDIDNFKAINDRYGHDGGDKVLKAVAQSLCDFAVTGHKLREDDVVARVGGEEFILVFPGTPLSEVERWLQKDDELRLRPIQVKVGKEEVQVTMSGGLTEYRHGEDFEEDTLKRADRGLYKSKHSGKNKIVLVQEIKKRA